MARKKKKSVTKKKAGRPAGTKRRNLPTVKERVNRRSLANKAINQKDLRESIAAGNHHNHILKSIEELARTYEEVKKLKLMDKGQQSKYMVQLGILKTKMDAQFKLLNKYLPDLRSIEFKEGDDGNPFATAAKAWAAALDEGKVL